jgi:hypothetical protein|tara:strand:- start:197 stop:310 length:114 start_codon:yes stop_codon:yes gene_type:complete
MEKTNIKNLFDLYKDGELDFNSCFRYLVEEINKEELV